MAGQRLIFRVVGIPATATAEKLKKALARRIVDAESNIKIEATLCDSCYTRKPSKTAFVQFDPHFPDYLRCLFGNATTPPEKEVFQMEMEPGFNISIDVNFYGLTQLYSIRPGVRIRADIVAVTGLDGHAYGSWRSKNTPRKMWLRDFLPDHLPECRTMIYGYNSKLAGYGTQTTLDYTRDLQEELKKTRNSPEEKQRPIIFIGHSYGGIIIVQTLMKFRDTRQDVDPVLHALYKAACGIIFFGTPHRGLLTSDIRQMVKSPHKQALLDSIAPGAEPLTSILERFIDDADRFKIVSFYETYPTRTLVQKEDGSYAREGVIPVDTTVNRNSSMLNLPAKFETRIPVGADHSEIAKFDNDTGVCETVIGHLQDLVEHVNPLEKGLETTIPTQQSKNKYYTVPHSASEIFTGRVDILKQMERCFFPERERKFSEPHPRRSFVLYGMGGSGKTQIALKFAEKHRDRFWGVFWIDATSKLTVEKSYCDISRKVSIESDHDVAENIKAKEASEITRHWLAALKEKWLLIVDNADAEELDIAQFLPTGNRGNILLASRDPASRIYGPNGNSREIGDMEHDEGIDFFLKAANQHMHLSNEGFRRQAELVVKEINHLALAIDQAGAYISSTGCEVGKYLELYKQHQKSLLAKRLVQGPTSYKSVVYTTWEVSLEAVSKKYPVAAEILQVFAFLHHQMIPEEIFRRASLSWRKNNTAIGDLQRLSWPNEPKYLVRLLQLYNDQGWNGLKFRDAIETLLSFSLVSRDSQVNPQLTGIRQYSVHPLIHSWMRDRIDVNQQQCFQEFTIRLLAISVASTEGVALADMVFHPQIAPHINAVCPSFQTFLNLGWEAEKIVPAANEFIRAYSNAGRLDENEDLQVQLIPMARMLLGEAHLNTLEIMGGLAATYSKQGRHKEAEQQRVHVLAIKKKVLGETHQGTLAAMGNLAATYSKQGHYTEAEMLEVQLMAMRRESLGKAHPDTLAAMTNLAMTYSQQGRHEEAEKLQEQEISMAKKVLGEAHPSTLESMNNLATTYSKQGRYKESEELLLQAITMGKKVYGEARTHPTILSSMGSLAATYSSQGHYTKAEELLVQVISMGKKVHGEAHPSVLSSIGNLATTYSNQGRHTRAEKLGVHVVTVMKSVLGEDHPDTLSSMDKLASAYFNQSRYEEAEALQVRLVAMKKRVLGETDPRTLETIGNLALTYSNQYRYAKAEELYVYVMARLKEVLGEMHPGTLETTINLARVYFAQGCLSEVEVLRTQVNTIQLGRAYPTTLAIIGNPAWMYLAQNFFSKSEVLQVQVIAMQKEILGEKHPDTLESMNSLALIYSKQRCYDEAEKLEIQTIAMRKEVLGEKHPATLASMGILAYIYGRQGRMSKMLGLLEELLKLWDTVFSPHDEKKQKTAKLAENLRSGFDVGAACTFFLIFLVDCM